jgi:hypothetical protein
VRGAVMYDAGDVRVEQRPDPQILKVTDAIIRLPASCICGSDLWPYRGLDSVEEPSPMGHEYVGIVEEVGDEVRTRSLASSWSDRSSPPTTPARSARPAISPLASTARESAPRAPKPS